MAVMNINSKKLKAMIENGKTFLVDFWAPWCPHCRKINPAYEQIAEQYEINNDQQAAADTTRAITFVALGVGSVSLLGNAMLLFLLLKKKSRTKI